MFPKKYIIGYTFDSLFNSVRFYKLKEHSLNAPNSFVEVVHEYIEMHNLDSELSELLLVLEYNSALMELYNNSVNSTFLTFSEFVKGLNIIAKSKRDKCSLEKLISLKLPTKLLISLDALHKYNESLIHIYIAYSIPYFSYEPDREVYPIEFKIIQSTKKISKFSIELLEIKSISPITKIKDYVTRLPNSFSEVQITADNVNSEQLITDFKTRYNITLDEYLVDKYISKVKVLNSIHMSKKFCSNSNDVEKQLEFFRKEFDIIALYNI